LGHVLDRQRAAVVRHERHGPRCHRQYHIHGEQIRLYAQRRTGVLFEQNSTADADIDGTEILRRNQKHVLYKEKY